MRSFLLGGLVLLGISTGAAAPWVAESGPGEVALLELYTSEGCSSCPPAERWLGELRHDPGLWQEIVPVAWHVTYWDRLGWTDPWADRSHTERQRAYAADWGARSIYTPGLVWAGREWRVGDPRPPGQKSPGKLRAVLAADGRLEVTFAPEDRARDWQAHAVLLGGGIVSEVRAGENRGRELRHEFVALGTTAAKLREAEAGAWTVALTLPAWPATGVTRRALAVWVSRAGEVAPVQATGGWLEP